VLAGTAAIGLARWHTLLALQGARRDVVATFARARAHAQLSGHRTTVSIAPPFTLIAHADGDTLARLDLHRHLVHLAGPPDSMTYTATGTAWGAANLRLPLTRDHRTDTVFVSRLGRVRAVSGR
jgi:hypothetical protein